MVLFVWCSSCGSLGVVFLEGSLGGLLEGCSSRALEAMFLNARS